MRNTVIVLFLAALQLSSAYGDAFLPFYWGASLSQELSIQLSGSGSDYYSPEWICSENAGGQSECSSRGTSPYAYGASAMQCNGWSGGVCVDWAGQGSYTSGYTPTRWQCGAWRDRACANWQASGVIATSYYCSRWDCTALNQQARACGEWSARDCTDHCYVGDAWQCVQWQSGRCVAWQGSGCNTQFRTRTKFTIAGRPSGGLEQNASAPKQQDATAVQGSSIAFKISINGIGNGTCTARLAYGEADNQSIAVQNQSGTAIEFNYNASANAITFGCDLDAGNYAVLFNATVPNATIGWAQDGAATPLQQHAVATISFPQTQLKFENIGWAIECLRQFACDATNGSMAVLQNATAVQVRASSTSAIGWNASAWEQPSPASPNATAEVERRLQMNSRAELPLRIGLAPLLLQEWNCSPAQAQLDAGGGFSTTLYCTLNALAQHGEGNWTASGNGVFEKTLSGDSRASIALEAIALPCDLPAGNASPLTIEPAQFTAAAYSNWTAVARAIEATPTPSPAPQPQGPPPAGGGGGGGFVAQETPTPEPTATPPPRTIAQAPTPANCAARIIAPALIEPGIATLRFFECNRPASGTAVLQGPGGTKERRVANGSLSFTFEREGKWSVRFAGASREITVMAAAPLPSALPLQLNRPPSATGMAIAGRPDYSPYLFLAAFALAGLYFSGMAKARESLEKTALGNSVLIRILNVPAGSRIELIDLVPDGVTPSKFSHEPAQVEETILGTKLKWQIEPAGQLTRISYEVDAMPESLPPAQLKAVDAGGKKLLLRSNEFRRP